MSFSDLQPFVELILTNNYVSLAVVTAVAYDYLLTFSREIDYVWRKPWTSVSTTFVFVRYVGLLWAIVNNMGGTTFIPGPQIMYVYIRTQIFDHTDKPAYVVLTNWGYLVFITAADLVMILRVYAMWNRSKAILYVLLIVYIPQTILGFVLTGIYDNPNTNNSNVLVTIIQVSDFTFCDYYSGDTLLSIWCVELPRILLTGALLFLAVAQTSKQSFYMYKATKLWQPNQYMQLFMRDGIIYFLVNILFNITIVVQVRTITYSVLSTCLNVFASAAICIMMPRFIIDVRELYERDTRGCCYGTDSGFGVSSHPVATQDIAVSAIEFRNVFPDQSQIVDEEADGPEGVRLEEHVGDSVGQV